MNRNPDILFTTEYIKNVLYFATVRPGKALINTSDVTYFCIDSELVYENYYSDFGPLNLGCVYKYCKILNDKLKQRQNRETVVHYTSSEAKKKANAAFLIGCYGVLYLNLSPRDALKPLTIHGQTYRPFQDATQGDSIYTITLMDCLCALKKARQLDFFDFKDFNYEEYERLDKIQGGDLNWIVPAKFLAFIGPVDYSVSLFHPPEMYIDYFKENNVTIVIRLNKRMYDGDVFNNAGITHYDLFFPDGSCPPRHILMKFLQIAEEADGAIAVHCKAGLGRTGSLIGCYLIKHYRMTAHEAIGWMRICRPGSVIGHQQGWLEHLEPWLIKQGNLYRKRMFHDVDKLPVHEFGVYSISAKILKQRPVLLSKSSSPPPPIQRPARAPNVAMNRPQSSKIRYDEPKEDEEFIASNDLTAPSPSFTMKLKGYILRQESYIVEEASDKHRPEPPRTFRDGCGRKSPSKPEQTEQQHDGQLKFGPKMTNRGSQHSRGSTDVSRRSSGAGEPRTGSARPAPTRSNSYRSKDIPSEPAVPQIPTFRTTQGSVIKTLSDAKNFLMKSSIYNQQKEKERAFNSSMLVTPFRQTIHHHTENTSSAYQSNYSSSYNTTRREPSAQMQRRRLQLGRSPSPSPSPSPTRATNTSPVITKDRATIRDALSNLRCSGPRGGSIGAASVGAASLGACRDAPVDKRAPSVRSDERPLATQGDMLNSIKFQRRLRDSLVTDKLLGEKNRGPAVSNYSSKINTGVSHVYTTKLPTSKEKSSPKSDTRAESPRGNSPWKPASSSFNNSPITSYCWPRPPPRMTEGSQFSVTRDKLSPSSAKFFSQARPTSPKGRQRTTSFF